MALLSILLEQLGTQPFSSLSTVLTLAFVFRCFYRVTLHPLAHVPGPILPKVTSLWLYYHSYVGNESSTLYDLHSCFGSIVRVSPNEVDIADGDAVASIYVNKGGFAKAPCYSNFDFDEHETIFSTRSQEYRNFRAKAVVSLFSTKNIRDGMDSIQRCANTLVSRLQQKSKKGRPVNLLNLTRSFAVDVVSAYLFQGGNQEPVENRCPLAVSSYVDEAVAVGRLFYLPSWIFHWVEWAIDKCSYDERAAVSMQLVDEYVDRIISTASSKHLNFPGRLLALGIEVDEVKVHCKDLIFAGTDSVSIMNDLDAPRCCCVFKSLSNAHYLTRRLE